MAFMRSLLSSVARRAAAARIALASAAALVTLVAMHSARAYSLQGHSWPDGEVVMRLGLTNPLLPLADGNTSFNEAVLPVLDMWNAQMGRIHLSAVMNASSTAATRDGQNSVVFSS